ncbi:MAG TPA: PhzF family phenazine biosynthesis protein [Burkholderiales bacterium]|nr:PhzF family phenazine biosynthesis protein [Burkholderiales bacterium]
MKFKQVDVFTEKPFRGNPVAVVLGAEGLDAAAMQRIANWTNLSETTFLLRSGKADYRLRIFTPRRELPFAGHPTIGSAHAALESGFVSGKQNLTQECGAGILELSVEAGWIYVTAPPPKVARVEKPTPFGRALRVDVGPVWIVAEMTDADALAALQPDMAQISSLSASLEATGVTLFARAEDGLSTLHVRSFAPLHGVPEDPVCGSGNISVAAFLRFSNRIEEFGASYVARQGMQMGRDGRVSVRVSERSIQIGGRAVTCVDGELKAT